MDTEASGFALSLGVSLLTVLVTAVQARVVTDALMGRLGLATLDDAAAQRVGVNKEQQPLNRHPKIVLAYISQALDVATNFPAGVLTLYAYLSLPKFPASDTWLAMFAAVAWALFSAHLAWPGYAMRYRDWLTYRGCSLLTAVLIAANAAGLILAIRQGHHMG